MRLLFKRPMLVMLVFVLACAAAPAVSAQTQAACGCAFVNNQPLREVKVEFAGSTRAVDATSDTVVHTGDLIKVTPQSSGTLICDNVEGQVSLKTTPRNQPVPCEGKPPDGIIIGRNGRKLNGNTMGASEGTDAIVVLSPRSTRLLDARPVLRWTTLAEATAYKVTVRGDEMSWSVNVPAVVGSPTQEINYPPPCAQGQTTGCASPLTAGKIYKLVVEANGRSSEEEDLPDLGFGVLTEDEARRVREKVEAVNRMPVVGSLKTYMRASVYLHHRLNDDAIRLLKESAKNPDAVRLLGDLFLKVALTREAETQYLSLLKPPLANLDTPAGAAITFQTLGEIYEVIGNTPEAVKYYTEAKSRFLGLKDRPSADLVGGRLSELTSQ